MLVDDRGRGPCLAKEPPARRAAGGQRRGQNLDRDVPAQGRVERLEHHPHPPAAEHALDLVGSEPAQRVGPVGRGQEVERFSDRRRLLIGFGQVGSKVTADRRQAAVAADQPVECLPAVGAPLQVMLQSGQLRGRQRSSASRRSDPDHRGLSGSS